MPWATIVGWTGLVLAVIGFALFGVAVAGAVDSARDPSSWGGLVAVMYGMFATPVAALALVVARVQARTSYAPRWRTRATTILSAVPLAVMALTVLVTLALSPLE